MEPIHGYVQNVTDRVIGATVQTAYTAGGTSLVVDDASVFSTLGGTLFFEDEDTASETVTYSAVDLDTDTLTIAAATYNHAAGIQVWDYPQNSERFAWVQTDDPDLAPVYCRVPHALRAMLSPGARSSISGDDDSGDYVPEEEVLVEFDGRDWVIRDVLRKDPAVTVNIGDASITEDAIYLGDVNIGDLTSDNAVTVNRETIVRFIDPTNGSDEYDGMIPITLADTFNRTTASGWGDASDGYHSWTRETGTAADFSTDTTPRASIAAAASTEYIMRLNGGGALAEEVYWEFQANKAPSTGTLDFGFHFRGHSKVNNYQNDAQAIFCRMSWTTTAAAPKAQIYKVVDGAYTSLGTTDLPAVFAVNTTYKARAQVYDVNGTTYARLRVWKGSDSEPATWTASGANGVIAAQTSDQTFITDRGGNIAVRQSVPAIANGPITTRLTTFTYKVLDLALLAADDTDTTAGTYDYAPATTPGVTQGPYATVGRALRDVPVYNSAPVALCISLGQKTTPGDGVTGVLQEQVAISGLQGGGKLTLTGCNPYWLGSLYIVGCSHNIVVSGITFSDPGDAVDNATINVNLSRYVELYQLMVEGNTTQADQNVLFQAGSSGTIQNCQLHGASNACLYVNTSSYVLASSNTGSAGISYRVAASILQSTGTVPTGGFSAGTTALIITGGTGSSNTNISSTASAPTTGGGTTPPTSTKKTKTWSASAGSTYGMSYGTWASGDVTQGAYGGGQNHRGVWKLPSTLFSTLNTKTMDSGYITVTRRGYGGSSGAQDIYLVSYTDNDFSGTPTVLSGPTRIGSLSWGQTKTFAIPSGILGDLNDGTNRALGVYQADGSPYVILSPNAKVKVTYH